MSISGVIRDSAFAYKRKVKVNPIERIYEDKGEKPYRKYNCPICCAVGNGNIGITEGIENCPLCGVALNWGRKPELGDMVILTGRKSKPNIRLEVTDEEQRIRVEEAMSLYGGPFGYTILEEEE